MGMTQIMEMVLNIGLQPALLLLFAGYFFKRDKDREESLVEEKYRNREEAKTQKDEISRELESARSQFRDKEALLMSENAKREELIRKESDKREQILKEQHQRDNEGDQPQHGRDQPEHGRDQPYHRGDAGPDGAAGGEDGTERIGHGSGNGPVGTGDY